MIFSGKPEGRVVAGNAKIHSDSSVVKSLAVRLGNDGAQGFGFIRTDEGDEYYFSRDNVASTPFEHLQTGTTVRFIPEVGGEGLQAKRVTLGKHSFL